MKFNPIKQKGLVKTALEEADHKISTMELVELIPGIYGTVTFRTDSDLYVLHIPENMDGSRFKFWRKTAAGLFLRSLKQLRKGNPSGEWLLIESKSYKSVVRLIESEELDEYKALRLVHGKIKDKYYMHLKTVRSSENINWDIGYIEQDDDELSDYDQAELEKALLEEASNPEGTKKTKNTAPKPGPLFK
jgi:hypothetical protein